MTVKPLDAAYGRWTVVSREGHRVTCRCECGSVGVVDSWRLRGGTSRSCGCLMREEVSARMKMVAKHRMSLTSEYRIWVNMRRRCSDKADGKTRVRYYERGIRVCDRWQESFENFYADMGPRPSMQHTLDRKDNDGNYEPENCRWATSTEQTRNTRRNHHLTAFGETKVVADWLTDHRCAVNEDTLRGRIRRGFDPEWAISAEPLRRGISDKSDRETAIRNDQRMLARKRKAA